MLSLFSSEIVVLGFSFSFINWSEVKGDLFLHILTENMIIWFSFLSKIGRR